MMVTPRCPARAISTRQVTRPPSLMSCPDSTMPLLTSCWTARNRFFRDNASGARGVVATSLKSCSNSDPPCILPSPQRTAIRRLPVF